MMKLLPLVATAGLLATLPSCLVVPPTADQPGYGGPDRPNRSPAYDAGWRRGHDDGEASRTFRPTRYSTEFTAVDRDDFVEGYRDGYDEAQSHSDAPDYGQPLTAEVGRGRVTILDGNRVLSVCETAQPYFEDARFVQEQDRIVVRSRGASGPPILELFRTRDGYRLDQAYARSTSPSWAAGL